MKKQVPTVGFFYRKGNRVALGWINKIKIFITKNYPSVIFSNKNPEVLMVLGGDGTILEAARHYHHGSNPIIFGLNLGTVGFLASVRDPKNFIKSVDRFLKGNFTISERAMLNAIILRGNKEAFRVEVLNELVIQSILGMVDLEILVDGNSIRKMRGSGVLIATATGSTAYNLSAHGPIIMPDIRCFIVTEIMGHHIPIPSIVVHYSKGATIKVKSFKQKGVMSISKSREKADVLLVADGSKIFSMKEGDTINVKNSSHLVKFVEIEKNYFFRSLKSKFSVK